jgi:hypothetical protein
MGRRSERPRDFRLSFLEWGWARRWAGICDVGVGSFRDEKNSEDGRFREKQHPRARAFWGSSFSFWRSLQRQTYLGTAWLPLVRAEARQGRAVGVSAVEVSEDSEGSGLTGAQAGFVCVVLSSQKEVPDGKKTRDDAAAVERSD